MKYKIVKKDSLFVLKLYLQGKCVYGSWYDDFEAVQEDVLRFLYGEDPSNWLGNDPQVMDWDPPESLVIEKWASA